MRQDEKFGTVTAWRKKEGQKISKGEDLCELEFTNFTINLNVEEDSYIAQILVPEGSDSVPVGAPLCVMVENEVSALTLPKFTCACCTMVIKVCITCRSTYIP